MRSGKNGERPAHGTFSLGIGAVLYVPLFIFALVFTQALRSSVSVVFMWFVGMLPVISFFYALIGRANVGAFVLSDETTAEKLTPVGYEFRVSNYSVLPMPFTEAEIVLPRSDGVSCESRLIRMSVLPRGEYRFKSSVTFKYRGSYRVGVGCIYVSDVLRIFRLRRFVNIYIKIYVMPRRLHFSRGDDNSPADAPTDSRMTDGIEASESNLIREYRNGDLLKHIHWKLSSKLGDLQVNDYKPNSGKKLYVFCDFATLFGDEGAADEPKAAERTKNRKKAREKKPRVIDVRLNGHARESRMSAKERMRAYADAASDRALAASVTARIRGEIAAENEKSDAAPNSTLAKTREDDRDRFTHADDVLPDELYDFDEFCADGVSELAIGAVLDGIDQGNSVTLMWFDERADSGFFAYEINAYSDIDAFFRQFGTAPFCPHSMKVTMLPTLVDDSDSPTFIFVTADAGIHNLGDFITSSHGAGAVRAEVMLFDPTEKFADKELHKEYVDFCRSRFAENKILLTAVSPISEDGGSDRQRGKNEAGEGRL